MLSTMFYIIVLFYIGLAALSRRPPGPGGRTPG
jgi:hypothetical protein